MATPYLGEIRMVSFSFAPKGWALCNGQTMPINQNQALFSLLGTTFGGDGRTTFLLPDLRGRTAMHVGTNGGGSTSWGQKGGEEMHALTPPEMPAHTHTPMASSAGPTASSPAGNFWASNISQYSKRPGDRSGGHRHWERWRRPGARESIALPGDQFRHRANGNFSLAKLSR